MQILLKRWFVKNQKKKKKKHPLTMHVVWRDPPPLVGAQRHIRRVERPHLLLGLFVAGAGLPRSCIGGGLPHVPAAPRHGGVAGRGGRQLALLSWGRGAGLDREEV